MSGHGVPSNYGGAVNPDAYTNAMWADARTKWLQLSKPQRRALIAARPVQGGRALSSDCPKQIADALVAKAIVEPSTLRRHMLTGIGVMVREAGIYTRKGPS